MMNEMQARPAIVRAAETVDELLCRAQAFGRKSHEAAIAAGELLIQAKAACRHGEWLPKLAAYGFTRTTAWRLMSVARRKCSNLEHSADALFRIDVTDLDAEEFLGDMGGFLVVFDVPTQTIRVNGIWLAEEREKCIASHPNQPSAGEDFNQMFDACKSHLMSFVRWVLRAAKASRGRRDPDLWAGLSPEVLSRVFLGALPNECPTCGATA